MTTRLIMDLHSGRGHEWEQPNNAALGDKCRICGARVRWHKRSGVLGMVRQAYQDGQWIDVPRDPQCLRLARWARATV
jgi:hypothetical protein